MLGGGRGDATGRMTGVQDKPMRGGAGSPMRVLVVDDSLDLQRSLTTMLASIPQVHVVGCAADAAGALAMVTTLHPDLVVLDVALQGHHQGIDVLQRVVREHADITVVMLSNLTWQAMRCRLLAAGAHAYFDKGEEFLQARDWIAARAAAWRPGNP